MFYYKYNPIFFSDEVKHVLFSIHYTWHVLFSIRLYGRSHFLMILWKWNLRKFTFHEGSMEVYILLGFYGGLHSIRIICKFTFHEDSMEVHNL